MSGQSQRATRSSHQWTQPPRKSAISQPTKSWPMTAKITGLTLDAGDDVPPGREHELAVIEVAEAAVDEAGDADQVVPVGHGVAAALRPVGRRRERAVGRHEQEVRVRDAVGPDLLRCGGVYGLEGDLDRSPAAVAPAVAGGLV